VLIQFRAVVSAGMNLVVTFSTNNNRFPVSTHHENNPLRGLLATFVFSPDVGQFTDMVYLYILS
jgi:hypothetical protein